MEAFTEAANMFEVYASDIEAAIRKGWYQPALRVVEAARRDQLNSCVQDLRIAAEAERKEMANTYHAIDNEAQLLNMVNIRAEMRDMIIRAAKQFKVPIVTHEERDGCYYTVIREGAVDAKAS